MVYRAGGSIKQYFIIILITLIFALGGYGASFLGKTQWKAEAQFYSPTVNQLGNYYNLASMHQFIQGQPFSEKALELQVYEEFKRQLFSDKNITEFWLSTSYYKQRETGDKLADERVLRSLVKTMKFSTALKGQAESISLYLDNPKQASELLAEFIAYTNLKARNVLYNELITQWKNLFNQVNMASQLNLGNTFQFGAIGSQDWQGKLNMMKSVSPLDNNLVAYRYFKDPFSSPQPERQVIYWIILAGLLGVIVGSFLVKIRKKS